MKTASLFEIPSAVEFGYCRVGTEEARTFPVQNRSNVPARFTIFSEIFTFTPRQGMRCRKYHFFE